MAIYDDSYKKTQAFGFALAGKTYHGLLTSVVHTSLHYHRDMELLWIEKGETVMQVGGETFHAKQGDMILIHPYEVHSGRTVGCDFSYRCIDFDLSLLGLPEERLLLEGQEAYLHCIRMTEAAKQHFAGCFEAIAAAGAGWKLQARGYLLLLFSCLDGLRLTRPGLCQRHARSHFASFRAGYRFAQRSCRLWV